MSNRSSIALRLLLVVSACAFAMPGAAQTAQQPEPPAPAHIAYLDSGATLVRDGRTEEATRNWPLLAGDQLRTRDGRVEIIYGDGSVLDVDHFTSVDFLSDDLLRLLEGRVRVTISGLQGRDRVSYRIDTPAGAVRIDEPGEYRVSLLGESGRTRDVELIAIRGFATLTNDLGETQVRAGERAFATATMAPSYAQAFNSATADAFDEWAADRRNERTGTTSSRYLPDEIRGYSGSFDRYGDWRHEDTYGYVWYPRVHVEWRPYYYGRWGYFGPWGWTWIAYDPWGWPTHHYGRWGFRAGAWFWIPSRRWGPAHVYWASAPGYVGWCPLGWDGRPVFSIINVNVGIGRRGHGYYDPYRAWTVVPRHAFASRGSVREYAVPRNTIERAVPRWSVESAEAPIRPSAAAARKSAPIYTAGRSYAVRRGVQPGVAAPDGVTTTGRRAPGATAYETAPSAPRASRRTVPESANVPRATPPAATGVLGAPAASRPAYVPRARSRDLGPGGQDVPEVRGLRPEGRGQRAEVGGQGDTERSRERAVGAPRGVTDYAPRGVPRGAELPNASSYEPRRPNADSYEGRRPNAYERPVRRNPEYPRPEYSRPQSPRPSGPPPSGYDRPTYSRPSPPPASGYDRPARERPAPSGGDRPTYSRPAPRGGGGDAPARATPRGGSAPRPSSPPPQSSGSGGHSRRRNH